MVFSYLVWGGTRRYGGVERKSLQNNATKPIKKD